MIVDTNIVLDMIDEFTGTDADTILQDMAARHSLIVNEIIFAEIASRFESAIAVGDMISALGMRLVRLSLDDCFRAGLAYRAYRRRGGKRSTILPDFLIGAQAATRGWPVVTRDRKGFASYFPEVELIDPLKA